LCPEYGLYYIGGAVGINLSGAAYVFSGWRGVAGLVLAMLAIPLAIGVTEIVMEKRNRGML